jgi:putative membrane protein
MSLFTPQEEQRVADAIAAVERKTSGEIVAVIAPHSDDYLHVPFLVAALIALIVPWPFIYLTWFSMQGVFLIQLLVFAAALAVVLPGRTRMWFVSKQAAREQAHRRAVEQFVAQNLHTSQGSTGVLIFVSLAERYAEIIADKAIDAKVDPKTWQTIVNQLTADLGDDNAAEGFVTAIGTCGQHLAHHFPPGSGVTNTLPNHLIVLR